MFFAATSFLLLCLVNSQAPPPCCFPSFSGTLSDRVYYSGKDCEIYYDRETGKRLYRFHWDIHHLWEPATGRIYVRQAWRCTYREYPDLIGNKYCTPNNALPSVLTYNNETLYNFAINFPNKRAYAQVTKDCYPKFTFKLQQGENGYSYSVEFNIHADENAASIINTFSTDGCISAELL